MVAAQSKLKRVSLGIVLLLILVVVLQNRESVDTRILFFTVSMPRVVLLLSAILTGFLGGFAMGAFYRRKKSRALNSD